MAGYLEEYGVGDLKRERAIRWILIVAAVLVVGAITGYFVFRTLPAKQHVGRFLDELRKGDYQAAYRLWGCAQPCRDYPFDKFMEDWGPKGELGDPAQAKITSSSFCSSGVIVKVSSPKAAEIDLWYQRSDGTLTYAPYPVCVERIPAPAAQ